MDHAFEALFSKPKPKPPPQARPPSAGSFDDESQTLPPKDFMLRECIRRGWADNDGHHQPPTTNPHQLFSLCQTQLDSPWARHCQFPFLQSAAQLSACLEAEYSECSDSAVNKYHLLQFKPQERDVIVCGLPRSGQTPVLQILASLKQGRYIAKDELLDHTEWIEAKHKTAATTTSSNGGRILKTHLPLRTVCGGSVPKSTATPAGQQRRTNNFRVIVCLRDPNDLRLAWYRHVRRVYGKFKATAAPSLAAATTAAAAGNATFDDFSTPDEWAALRMYCLNPNHSSQFDQALDYEDFVFECLEDQQLNKKRQILLCFYEDLVANPAAFVRRIAEFVGSTLREDLRLEQVITRALYCEPEFPRGFFHCDKWEPQQQHQQQLRRVGSTKQASTVFSSLAMRRNDEKWKQLASVRGPSKYESYGELRRLQREEEEDTTQLVVPSRFATTAEEQPTTARTSKLASYAKTLRKTVVNITHASSNGEGTSPRHVVVLDADETRVDMMINDQGEDDKDKVFNLFYYPSAVAATTAGGGKA